MIGPQRRLWEPPIACRTLAGRYMRRSRRSNSDSEDRSSSEESSRGSYRDSLKLVNLKRNAKQSLKCIPESFLDSSASHLWELKEKLSKQDLTIESLENVVKAIMEKQKRLLEEMYDLRNENGDLLEESQMQRDYHTMERNTILKELQEVRERLRSRSRLLEKAVSQNRDLMFALQEANEKIFQMGVKMLEMQARHREAKKSEAVTKKSSIFSRLRESSSSQDPETTSTSTTSDTD